MSALGTVQTLSVARINRAGAWLEDDSLGEVLLPAREASALAVGDRVRVLLYLDGEERPTATGCGACQSG